MQIIRINVRFHPTSVHCFTFFKVYQVYFYLLFPTIFYCEIKPLCVSSRIRVWPHKQIILIFIYFDTYIQISTLKVAIKYKLLSFRYGGIHSLENSCCFWLKIRVKFTKISCHMKIIWAHNTFFNGKMYLNIWNHTVF